MGTVITCEILARGQKISGKIVPTFYFPTFARVLKDRGLVHHETYGIDQLRKVRADKKNTLVVLIHSETYLNEDAEYLERVSELERYAIEHFGERSVIHPTRVGLKIGDKMAANQWLSAAGLPMPSLLDDKHAPTKVFSNRRVGTNTPIQLVAAGRPLNAKRYNTKFIDTTHEYNGKAYYVSLRAMGVGRRCVAAYARMRPIAGGPSVHDADTPRDPKLINYFHQELVTKKMHELRELSDRLGKVLGIGFYAHDILPEAKTGNLYLCETGYKVDEGHLRSHLKALRAQLVFRDSLFEPFVEASAKAFLEEVAQLRLLSF